MTKHNRLKVAECLTLCSSSSLLGVSLLLLITTVIKSPFHWFVFLFAIVVTVFFAGINYAAIKKKYNYQIAGLIVQSLLLVVSWWLFGIGKLHVFWLYAPVILFVASISALWLLCVGNSLTHHSSGTPNEAP